MRSMLLALALLSGNAAAGDRCVFTAPTEAKVTKIYAQETPNRSGHEARMAYTLETANCTINALKSVDPMGDRLDININDHLVIKKFKNGHFDAYRLDGKKHRTMDVISAE
jgi:hypothetical protein